MLFLIIKIIKDPSLLRGRKIECFSKVICR